MLDNLCYKEILFGRSFKNFSSSGYSIFSGFFSFLLYWLTLNNKRKFVCLKVDQKLNFYC